MIRLDIQEYCGSCCDFDPDVTKPAKLFGNGECVVQTDTVVRCTYTKRCESIRRFLKQQMEETKNNEKSV